MTGRSGNILVAKSVGPPEEVGRMTGIANRLKDVLERVKTWPEFEQEELAEYAEAIESRHGGDYEATAEELEGIRRWRSYWRSEREGSCRCVQDVSSCMKVEYSKRAAADLRKVSADSLAFGETVAAAVEFRIREIVEQIRKRPKSRPGVIQRPGVRVALLIRYPYKIFCRVLEDRVRILHIRHTSRRPW